MAHLFAAGTANMAAIESDVELLASQAFLHATREANVITNVHAV